MRAALNVYGDQTRKIWVADLFEGLPKPDGRYQQDEGDIHWTISELAISLDVVKENFPDTACWMSACVFSRAGSRTRYRQRRLSDWQSYGWMAICTHPLWTLSRASIRNSHPVVMPSSMITRLKRAEKQSPTSANGIK